MTRNTIVLVKIQFSKQNQTVLFYIITTSLLQQINLTLTEAIQYFEMIQPEITKQIQQKEHYMFMIKCIVRIEVMAQGITLRKIMILRCGFGPSTTLQFMHMIQYLITTFFKTDDSQRKVNVAFVITIKDALQNSTYFNETFIIFSLAVQSLLCWIILTKYVDRASFHIHFFYNSLLTYKDLV